VTWVSLASTQTAHILFSSTELPSRIVILSTTGELFLIDSESFSFFHHPLSHLRALRTITTPCLALHLARLVKFNRLRALQSKFCCYSFFTTVSRSENFPSSGPWRSLLPPNSLTPIDRFSVSTLTLTSSHVLPAGHIPIARTHSSPLGPPIFHATCFTLSLHTVDHIFLPLHPTCLWVSDSY
jgi:hypothetical protein